ncbi:hypothetical protein AVEN_132637-1 [Araneus ventricosus]|uniref:Transposase Tc1-like domain-containing protein n=1 Tax=Araneus ventricosus TaxID=182803 RepID=A0A4Y2AXC4_ARAVE|nr:hypothetical protein AVEN_132637-1 [Araneus ventricosus]
MGSQSRRPTRVPLLTALHKALRLAWARQHYHTVLMMTGNTSPGLTSLASNCIGRMHVYEYGDNINNPYWIIHPVCQQGTVQSGGASVMVWNDVQLA